MRVSVLQVCKRVARGNGLAALAGACRRSAVTHSLAQQRTIFSSSSSSGRYHLIHPLPPFSFSAAEQTKRGIKMGANAKEGDCALKTCCSFTEKVVFGAFATDAKALSSALGASCAGEEAAKGLSAKIIVGPSGTVSLSPLLVDAGANPLAPVVAAHFAALDQGVTSPLGCKQSSVSQVIHWVKQPNNNACEANVFAEYKDKLSRNMGLFRSDLLQSSVLKALEAAACAGSGSSGSGNVFLVVVLKDPAHALSAAAAVARCFGPYSRKTGKEALPKRTVLVDFVLPNGCKASINYAEAQAIANAVRQCQYLVDAPCSELHADALVEQAEATVARLQKTVAGLDGNKLKIEVMRREDLIKGGFGGISAVGRAARHGPALCVLTRAPVGGAGAGAGKCTEPGRSLVLVGKGIVFDSGGLSLKQSAYMIGMKHDMGGAAAVLTAFEAAVAQGIAPDVRLHAVLCIAENAIGSDAYRNDDILHMYSGKTVEINNTDAEGRLVLADGVAYAARHLVGEHKKEEEKEGDKSCAKSLIVTIATLTGAQAMATGLSHAGVMANCAKLESAAICAGKRSGDLVFPLLYAPELLRSQFKSAVADMKNSVKDRTNAPSSAAGHFIEAHLGDDYAHGYVHFDIAAPCSSKERATGFGAALLYEVARSFGSPCSTTTTTTTTTTTASSC